MSSLRCGSTAFTVTICLVVTGVVGLGLLGGGIGAYLSRDDNQDDAARAVENAIKTWADPTSPNGIAQFKLDAFVVLRKGPLSTSKCVYQNYSRPLKETACSRDVYKDPQFGLGFAPQKAYCFSMNTSQVYACNYQAEFYYYKPGTDSATLLATIPPLLSWQSAQMEINMFDVKGPDGCNPRMYMEECHLKAKSTFDYFSMFSYSKSFAKCGDVKPYAADFAIKVKAVKGSPGLFVADTKHPRMGPNSYAANALPKGYRWVTSNNQSGNAPRWQYQKLAFKVEPSMVTFTIRSSYDPWLTYLAETDGSLYFSDPEKESPALGIALIVVGSVITFCVLVFSAYLLYSRVVYKRSPDSRPSGCLAGMAWSMGRGIFGPNATDAQASPLQAGPAAKAEVVENPYPYHPVVLQQQPQSQAPPAPSI